jgi:hypothetical protein
VLSRTRLQGVLDVLDQRSPDDVPVLSGGAVRLLHILGEIEQRLDDGRRLLVNHVHHVSEVLHYETSDADVVLGTRKVRTATTYSICLKVWITTWREVRAVTAAINPISAATTK